MTALATWALLQYALVAGAPSGLTVADAARRDVRLAFERAGRSAPGDDLALNEAAQSLAAQALASPSSKLGDSLRVAQAVSVARGFDPSPRALFLRGTPAAEVLRSLEERQDVGAEPATHVGVGWAADGERGSLVVLLAERKAMLRAFPHRLGGPSHHALCGALREPLGQPLVYVTRPGGTVEKLPPPTAREDGFCADVGFHEDGVYTVELLGTGPQGPEVAALFFVVVGKSSRVEESFLAHEPATPSAAATEILSRINALRLATRAPPVTLDAALNQVAQAYSDRMAREHFFAHIAPDGVKLADRLRAARYPFRTAGENLGLASGPLAAHFGIEHSPGHRKNLMEPAFTRLGLGFAVERVSGREQLLLTEVLAAPLASSADPLLDAYRAYDALRAQHHLPPLKRSATLEALAKEQAQRALELDQPRVDLPGKSVHDRVFASVPGARRASLDLFITSELGALPDSRSLADGANNLMGIGAAHGDSPRYGRDRYWVVVLFASTREEQ